MYRHQTEHNWLVAHVMAGHRRNLSRWYIRDDDVRRAM